LFAEPSITPAAVSTAPAPSATTGTNSSTSTTSTLTITMGDTINTINTDSNTSTDSTTDSDRLLSLSEGQDGSLIDTCSTLALHTPPLSSSTGSDAIDNIQSGPRYVVRKRQRFTSTRAISTVDSFPSSNTLLTSIPSSASASLVDRMPGMSQLHPADRLTNFSSDYHCSAACFLVFSFVHNHNSSICLALMKEAFISRCGHSFCYLCITQHLSEKQDCPICRSSLTRDQIFPNFLRILAAPAEESEPRVKLRHDLLSLSQGEYTRDEIEDLLSTLKAKKRKLEATDQQVELEALARLNAQIQCLDNDMRKAQDKLDQLKQHSGYQITQALEEEEDDQAECTGNSGCMQVPNEASEEEDEAVPPQAGNKRSRAQLEREEKKDGNNTGKSSSESTLRGMKIVKQVNVNKKRVAEHFEDLQRCYFDFSLSSSARRESALSSFCSTISKFTKFSRFEHVNTLRYGDIFNTSSIVSSIEFDRDDEYFATAGVTKKIKIFEYGCIEKTGLGGSSLREDDRSDMYDDSDLARPPRYASNKKPITSVLHYPVREMMCRSKISCLSWNSYIKSTIASSDYEGIVSLWDAQTGVNTLNYDEHEKRAWSVDFSRTDPTRLASGSDDTKVKIWSTTHKASVCTIESKANICCVKFNPESSHHIAFGSADHHIHYYDLRKPSEPLFVFKGHRKAVSYVKFLGREELVSASTDSTLKLWNTLRMNCVRTYTGHVNEKNFVGLSASGDWISCGSENNAVYTYYKELRDPVVTVKFGSSNPVTGEDTTDEDPSQFVSSVCWKKNTSNNILLAANSSGVIKVLEMV
ncbi:RING finger and WD repeat domain-containing protein 2, partial [Dissophora globulifera]